jgi:hypothetical protein
MLRGQDRAMTYINDTRCSASGQAARGSHVRLNVSSGPYR